MKAILLTLALTSALFADPLPSWNNSDSKKAIIGYVEKVSTIGSPDFVPVEARIATLDNDGTLWSEAPLPPQAVFAFDEIKRLLPENPEWKDDPSIQALANKDVAALTEDHAKGLFDIIAKTHAGISPEEFNKNVSNWMATANCEKYDRPYSQTVFQPMLELLSYLRDHGFETWIVSGGGQDFMRVFVEETYGVVPQQVIGSYALVKFEMKDGKPTLTKTMETVFIDDKQGKPEAIHRFIGRRPIAAFGNSDGDQAMLEYTTIGNPYPSFGLLVHHTDGEREWAYDTKAPSSGTLVTALVAAKEHGWTVVDMKNDWKTVFPEFP